MIRECGLRITDVPLLASRIPLLASRILHLDLFEFDIQAFAGGHSRTVGIGAH